METQPAFARCLAYLDSQSRVQPGLVEFHSPLRMSVALSRETGAGALAIAEKLAEFLQAHTSAAEQRPWTVFDKNLITEVLEDHHLPARLAKFLPEARVSAIRDAVDELLGLHPSSWVVIHQCTETILRLAELGNVILVGRGANAITSRLPNVLRVRLIGSLERRVACIQEAEHLNLEQARAFVRRSDRERAGYVKTYFHQDINDPLLHDLTINTDRLSMEETVQLIGGVLLQRLEAAGGEVRQAA